MPFITFKCDKCGSDSVLNQMDIVDGVCNKCVGEFIKELMIKEGFLFTPGKDAKEITL